MQQKVRSVRKLLMIVPICFFIIGYKPAVYQLFPIKKVSFSANITDHEQKDLSLIANEFTNHGFLGIDLMLLKKTMEQYSWVKLVKVSRVWPEQIHAEIVKRKPVAKYNHNLLLDDNGVLFNMPDRLQNNHLPQLMSKKNNVKQLSDMLNTAQLELNHINFKIKQIEYKSPELIEIATQQGIVIKVRENQFKRSLLRFIYWYQLFHNKKKKSLNSVDLRYNNGLAVGYKI